MMRDHEIQLFIDGLRLAQEEFYLDSIKVFRELIDSYPDSELVDDAYYDVGLCFFNMGQFNDAHGAFMHVINEHPNSTISVLEGSNEYGKTATKCWYALVNCCLAQGELDRAREYLRNLDYDLDSYLIVDDVRISFHELASRMISEYIHQKGTRE